VQRALAAKERVENLNPLVTVEALASMEGDRLDTLVSVVDLVCVTDSSRSTLVSTNPNSVPSLGECSYS
jgi:ubiquitin-like 1-activating enzyme E1 A